ncbi:Serine protease inhibitor dipetalogastin [Tetrabaena socialis]|uniref:Serine protease inhibitor dipetalogastin n=1 Tax=Tetrabaena socialis TaxID=47790 RepID=A0A2J7ZU21_9CHLO|nr:Serine protease inhibitor dipetalogastin [Tetrabaena socialis]|eukprot:PNH03776.1 Serine protease inhibitor dipetalogastin [Tetrabaena socialis]
MAESRRCSTAMLSAYTILGLALLAGSAAQDGANTSAIANPTCPGVACTGEFSPVCGADGSTYANKCFALECAKAEIQYSGRCADPAGCADVVCNAQYLPVCGANNVTYSNDCNARCTGVTIAYKGKCGAREGMALPLDGGGAGGTAIANPTCPCVARYDILSPVCGADGSTYANECFASKCAKVDIKYTGRCADPAGCADVACVAQYLPVCGANNVTYPHECNARCTGVTIAYTGKCGAPNNTTKGPTDGGDSGGGSPSCACPKILSPVCGNGTTYDSKCLASCANATMDYTGNCTTPGEQGLLPGALAFVRA